MLLDFEVRTCSRQCVESGKELQPGQVYFSMLSLEGSGQHAETVRNDYSAEAWPGPSESSLGWWRSRVPLKDEKPKLAPTEVMLNLFTALSDQASADSTQDRQFRYLLGLLLVRRRVLRREDSIRDEADQEVLTLFSSRRDERYELIVDEPNPEQAAEIQQRMIDLLYGDGDGPANTPNAEAA
jgi:hypothetical protein